MRGIEWTVDDRAGRRLVAATAESGGERVAVKPAAAAEAHLDPTVRLLDQDRGHLGALHGQREVDEVLGVGGLRLHLLDVVLPHGGDDHLAVVRSDGAGDRPPHEVEPCERILLEEFAVDGRWIRPGIDEPARDPKRLATHAWKPEAAGVGGEAGVERRGDRLGERHAEPQADLVDDPGGRLGRRVLEPPVGVVVFAEVMIDDEHAVTHRLGDVAHRSELGPGAGVEHDEEITVGEVGRPHLLRERLDLPPRVDPFQVGRGRLSVDDPHVLADRLQDPGHAEFAAEGVAVGPHVAREHHLRAATENLEERRPVESHHVVPGEEEAAATIRPATATSSANWALRSSTDAKRRVSRTRSRKSTSRTLP